MTEMIGPLRILLIEDDDNDALLLQKQMKKDGFDSIIKRVETAPALKSALEEEDWDIVVSDYVLPEFSGPEALDVVTSQPKDIPFIMVSGKMGEEFAVEAMRHGAADYILKENMSRLVPVIKRELRDVEIRRQQARSEKELEQAREQYRLVVEGINEGIAVVRDGILVFVNRGFSRMLGYPIEEITGSPLTRFHHPDDRERALEYHRKRMADEDAPDHYDMRLINSRNEELWLEISSTLIDWEGAKASLSFISDVSHRKKLEEELRQTNAELKAGQEDLKRKNIALSEMLERLEHDKKKIENRLIDNVENTVIPILRRIKSTAEAHRKKDLEQLEAALDDIMSPFIGHLKGESSRLSSREIEVCRLIKGGATSKDIADSLNIALATVKKYRETIRKKLGLTHKEVNLASYLKSLDV